VEELRAMLSVSRAAAAVFPARFRGIDHMPTYRDLSKATPALRTLVAIDGGSGDGVLSWRDLLAEGAGAGNEGAALNWLRPSPDDVCQLFLARDAHGELRGTLHTANTLGAAVEAVIRGQRLTSADRIHSAASPTHQLGFLLGVRLPIRLGAVAVLQDTWEPDAFLRLVEEERISVTFGGRPVLAGVLDVLERGANDIGTLRLLGVSGTPLPVALAQQAVRRLPGRVSPLWGSSEAGIVTGVLPGAPAEKVITSAGCPYPSMEVVARDGDGTTLPPGAEGALWVRGASLFAGYLQGRRFTKQFVDAEGWFNTGALGMLDADGYVSVHGPTAVT
jgi:cyclohexanecarboxylate-CoA ligase